MILSVLIPSVPSRREMALALYDSIAAQAEGLPVEILLLLDNKQRSIGKKREALVQIARGDYLVFVDDDDTVADSYVEQIVRAIEARPDVVVFDSLCTLNDGPTVRVRHGLELENQQYNPDGFTRKPWHVHPWRRELVQGFSFPDTNVGEDWGWCEQFVTQARTQARTEDGQALYHYRFNQLITEATPATA